MCFFLCVFLFDCVWLVTIAFFGALEIFMLHSGVSFGVQVLYIIGVETIQKFPTISVACSHSLFA